MTLLRIWRNRNFILILGLTMGVGAGQFASWSKHAVLPALAVVMTLSTTEITSRIFRNPRSLILPSATGLFMNFLILGGVILALGHLLIRDEEIRTGFILLAIVPPAVAVIPFTGLLGGDTSFSLVATTGSYLAALVITPMTAMALLGSAFFDPLKLMLIIVQLILLPLLLSRIMRRTSLADRLQPAKGVITNWCFFLIIYTIVGLNRDLFLNRPLSLLPVAGVAFCSTFVLGACIQWMARWRGLKESTASSLVLLGTLKNSALAGGLALTLFGEHTALPAAVSTVFMIVYMIWLSLRMPRGRT